MDIKPELEIIFNEEKGARRKAAHQAEKKGMLRSTFRFRQECVDSADFLKSRTMRLAGDYNTRRDMKDLTEKFNKKRDEIRASQLEYCKAQKINIHPSEEHLMLIDVAKEQVLNQMRIHQRKRWIENMKYLATTAVAIASLIVSMVSILG